MKVYVQMPEGKPEKLTQGIAQYRDKLVRYLKKCVPHDYVEDVAQETLLNAHAYMSNGNKLDKPLAFLYTTANNVVRKNYRDRKMAAVTDSHWDIDAFGLTAEGRSVELDVVSELEFEAFCVAIGRLPDKCRKAFVLRKVYQYSYNEIAEHCGVSVHTVKNHVKKGFKLVQAYLEERDCPRSS
jgi:RNA polymerase sigma-70 factor (ECF subfamily)